jgi:hypothetical protein
MAKRAHARVAAPRVLVSWSDSESPVPVDAEEVKPLMNRAERRARVRELTSRRSTSGRTPPRKGPLPGV